MSDCYGWNSLQKKKWYHSKVPQLTYVHTQIHTSTWKSHLLKLLKLGQVAFRNQASCSMRLLRKRLCCTLPSLFLLWLTFYFICRCSLLQGQFAPKVHNKTNWLQGKLQWSKLVCLLDSSRLHLSLSSHQRPVLECKARHLFNSQSACSDIICH